MRAIGAANDIIKILWISFKLKFRFQFYTYRHLFERISSPKFNSYAALNIIRGPITPIIIYSASNFPKNPPGGLSRS